MKKNHQAIRGGLCVFDLTTREFRKYDTTNLASGYYGAIGLSRKKDSYMSNSIIRFSMFKYYGYYIDSTGIPMDSFEWDLSVESLPRKITRDKYLDGLDRDRKVLFPQVTVGHME